MYALTKTDRPFKLNTFSFCEQQQNHFWPQGFCKGSFIYYVSEYIFRLFGPTGWQFLWKSNSSKNRGVEEWPTYVRIFLVLVSTKSNQNLPSPSPWNCLRNISMVSKRRNCVIRRLLWRLKSPENLLQSLSTLQGLNIIGGHKTPRLFCQGYRIKLN